MNKGKYLPMVLLIVGGLLGFVLGVSLVGGCRPQILAYRASDASSLPEKERVKCIPLFLPRTVLEFRCTGVVETREPSLLWCMASDKDKKADFNVDQVQKQAALLGVTLNKDPSIKYSIRDPVLMTRGERDPNELFLVSVKCRGSQKAEFTSQFSPDGVAGSVSSAVEDRTFEFATKTIETGAGVVGRMMGLVKLAPARRGLVPEQRQPTEEPNLLRAVAERIMAVRAYRESLIGGTAHMVVPDEKSFVRMLDELAKLEAGLVAYFTGVHTEELFPLTSTIRPVTSTDSRFELFKFNKDTGFEANPDTEQVRLSLLPERLCRKDVNKVSNGSSGRRTDPAYAITLTLSPAIAEMDALRQIRPSEGIEHGLPYRIPVRVFAEVRMEPTNQGQVTSPGTKSLVKTEILLGQWGHVAYLPPSVGSSGSAVKPVYYTETGALKELTVTGTPLAAESLGSLDKAAGSIAEALKTQEARSDELSQLKREGDILEQKVRIQDLQEKVLPSGAP